MSEAKNITVTVQVENLPAVQRTLAKARAEIERLTAQVAQQNVTIARYKHAYQAEKNMFEDCETLRQAEMATIAQLRAQLNAVPIDYIAFLIGFVEGALGRTRQSTAVADWANSIVAAKESGG